MRITGGQTKAALRIWGHSRQRKSSVSSQQQREVQHQNPAGPSRVCAHTQGCERFGEPGCWSHSFHSKYLRKLSFKPGLSSKLFKHRFKFWAALRCIYNYLNSAIPSAALCHNAPEMTTLRNPEQEFEPSHFRTFSSCVSEAGTGNPSRFHGTNELSGCTLSTATTALNNTMEWPKNTLLNKTFFYFFFFFYFWLFILRV